MFYSVLTLQRIIGKRWIDMWNLLKNRNLTLIAVGNTISQFGDRLTHMALIGLIAAFQPGSSMAFSKMAIFFSLPVILLALPGGILADRFPRKRILLIADFSRAVLLGGMAYSVYHWQSMNVAYAIVFLVFVFTIFFNVTRGSFIPEIVPEQDLLHANSLMTFLARIATVLGTVLGGFIADHIPFEVIFVGDGLTYLVSFLCILAIRPLYTSRSLAARADAEVQMPPRRFSPRALWNALKHPVVRVVMLSVALFGLLSAASYSLMIPLVQQLRGWGTSGVGIMGGMIAVGMILGAWIMGHFGRDTWMGPVLAISFLLLGSLTALMPRVVVFWGIGVGAIVAGALSSAILIVQDTLFQKKVENALRGQVFGSREVVVSISFLVNTVGLGWLGDHIGMWRALVLSGVAISVGGVAIGWLWRKIPSST